LPGHRTLTILGAALLVLLPAAALGSGGDFYLAVEGDYRSVAQGDVTLHTPSLTLGGGVHVSDFAVLEGTLWYGGTLANGHFENLAAVALSFRFLIDATQWIPSIGPEVGYLAGYGGEDGLRHGFYAGGSACIDYRIWRTHSLALCGEYAVIPFQDDYDSFFGLGFRVNGFLPYLFE
jgi:hypothetical protein